MTEHQRQIIVDRLKQDRDRIVAELAALRGRVYGLDRTIEIARAVLREPEGRA